MRTDETSRDTFFDRRVVERNIQKGVVTREEYERHLQALPDTASNVAFVAARLDEHEDNDNVDDIDEVDDETDEG